MSNVLVFGCSGFIGSRVIALLLKSHVEVTCVIHRKKVVYDEKIEYVQGSLETFRFDKINLHNYDAIFILARAHGPIRTIRLLKSLRVAKNLTKLIKEMERLNKATKLIYLTGTLSYSSREEYVDETAEIKPTSYYKQYIHTDKPILKALKTTQLPIYVLRAPWVYGNGSWFKKFYMEPIKKHGYTPIYGEGENYMTLIHVNDCAKYIYYVATKEKKGIYNTVTHKPIKQKELALKIAKITKTPIKKIPLQKIAIRYGRETAEALQHNLKLTTIHKHIQKELKPYFKEINKGLKHTLSVI